MKLEALFAGLLNSDCISPLPVLFLCAFSMKDDLLTKHEKTGEFVAEDQQLANLLFGRQNRHLKLIERYLGVRITSNGNRLILEGDPPQVKIAVRLCA